MTGFFHGRRRQIGATAGVLAPLLVASHVSAGDLDVTTSRTTAVSTSNANNGAGNVTVESNGGINVTDPVAVTIDSSNTVSNAGVISTSSALSNAAALRAITGQTTPLNLTSGIINTGTISTTGTVTSTDIFNSGIDIRGLGTFTGDITNSGTISVAGQGSYGISINAPTVGDITSSGSIAASAANSYGIFTTAPVTGSITNAGTISMPGASTVGMYIGNSVSGTVTQGGLLNVGSAQGLDLTNIDPKTGIPATIPQVPGTAGMWIAGSVGQGVMLTGNGSTKAQEAADSTISTAGESTITAIGAPGLVVAPGGPGGFHNITIGPNTSSPYGILNLGNIISLSQTAGVNALGVDIRGAVNNGTTYTTTVSGGLINSGGNIDVTGTDANATGIHIGAGASLPEIRNTGDILINTLGPTNAYGVLDRSGSITTFTNSGTITPTIATLSPGSIVGVDLSANTTGVNFSNTGKIIGPVLLGTGTNTFSMTGGTQTGNVSFVGGTSTLNITNSTITGNVALGASTNSSVSLTNSTLTGSLNYTTGSANFSSINSTVTTSSTAFMKVTNASFDSTSTLKLSLNGANTATGGTLIATGNVSFANGAKLTPVFTGIFAQPQTLNLVSAGTLTLGAPISSLVTPNDSFMNLYTAQLDPNNANNLQLIVRRKTPTELGLDANMGAVYNGAVGALSQDSAVATALQAASTRAGFLGALRQLMPDVTDATLQAAVGAQDMTLGMLRRRMVGIPDYRAGQSGERSSIWVQAIGSGADAKQQGDELGYSWWGVGLGLGAEAAFGSTTKVGLAATEMFTSVSYGASPNSPMFIYGTHVNLYGRQELGPFYLQGLAGGGYNSYRQTHHIAIDTLSRTAEGKGNGYEYGGNLEFGTRIGLGNFMLDPYLRASYLQLHRNAFVQSGGGGGIDYQLDANTQTSTRGSAGFNLERDFTLYYDSVLETDLRASYTREFHTTPAALTSHFLADPATTIPTSVLLHGPSYYTFGFGVGHKDSFSSVTLDYDAQIASHFMGHTATVTLRFRF